MFKRINKRIAAVLAVSMLVGIAYAVQTVLTPQVLKENNYAVLAGDLTLTMTASDTVNGNAFQSTGREMLIVQNTDTVAHTFGITSIADQLGRVDTSLSAYSVAGSGIAVIHLDTLSGWRQSNGQIFLTSTSALLKFGVVRLPG
jgi:hypothetical protein